MGDREGVATKSYFMSLITKALTTEYEGESDSEDSDQDIILDKNQMKSKGGTDITQNELNKISSIIDDPNTALLYSAEKYHEHLLNCMNIRADPAWTEHFAEFLNQNDYDKSSDDKDEAVMDEENQSYQDSDENDETFNQDESINKDYKSKGESERQDMLSSRRDDQEYEEEDKNQYYENESERSSKADDRQSIDPSDMPEESQMNNRKPSKPFVNPFDNLPERSNDANHYSNNIRLSLATLVMNNQVQKLFEENRRLKAKIHIMDKQMKTSDPFKKWKYNGDKLGVGKVLPYQQQIEALDTPGALKNYKLYSSYPFVDGIAYKTDADRVEDWKNRKKSGADESDDPTNPLGEYSSMPPDLIQSSYSFTSFGRKQENSSFRSNSPRSDIDKSSNFIGTSNANSASGRKRRYRRRANQISRTYVCQLHTCRKAYGSEGSLNQHMKLKHPEYYQQSDMSSRKRGRIGNRHIMLPGSMHPPPPVNQYQMMNQFQRFS